MAWLAVLVFAGVVFGAALGVVIWGSPGLPRSEPPLPPDLIIDIALQEFAITAEPAAIPPGAEVEFVVSNDGELQHDFKVEGQTGLERIPPGGGGRFRFGPITEELAAWCTIPGHREQGMEITLQLTDEPVNRDE
jgi:nitrite reductase (NO-forming)